MLTMLSCSFRDGGLKMGSRSPIGWGLADEQQEWSSASSSSSSSSSSSDDSSSMCCCWIDFRCRLLSVVPWPSRVAATDSLSSSELSPAVDELPALRFFGAGARLFFRILRFFRAPMEEAAEELSDSGSASFYNKHKMDLNFYFNFSNSYYENLLPFLDRRFCHFYVLLSSGG
jgi:hypothetical protein